MNTTVYTLSSRSTSLGLEVVIFRTKSKDDGLVDRNDDNVAAWELREIMNDDVFRFFSRFSWVYVFECGCRFKIVWHEKVYLPKSSYDSWYRAPTLTEKMRTGLVIFDDHRWRNVQKVVTAKFYNGSSVRRDKTVLVL